MVVGVNGSGKTTTIGKLAHRFVQEGRKVLLAPGDTFRAGAVAQLKHKQREVEPTLLMQSRILMPRL